MYIDIIRDELNKIGGMKNGSHVWICCPFHQESKPSCSVALEGTTVPLGTFHCFGCSASGSWNKLAYAINAPQLDQKLLNAEFQSTPKTVTEVMLSDNIEDFLTHIGFDSYMKWVHPDRTNVSFFKKWYQIDGKLLYDLGTYVVKERDGVHRLFLPVTIWDVIYGGTRVSQNKEDNVKTYLNTSGNWSEKYGLFPFDFVVKHVMDNNVGFLILVEGPRDALRLINMGLPALAILGSHSFSHVKATILSGIRGINTIYVIPDRDAAGDKMRGLCKNMLHEFVTVKMITLPEFNSKQEKSDPQNADRTFLLDVKRKLSEIHPNLKRFRDC